MKKMIQEIQPTISNISDLDCRKYDFEKLTHSTDDVNIVDLSPYDITLIFIMLKTNDCLYN